MAWGKGIYARQAATPGVVSIFNAIAASAASRADEKEMRHMLNLTNHSAPTASLCLSIAMLGLAFPALLKADDSKEQGRVTEARECYR